MAYVLHYAPDNASLIVRLALEHRGLPYRTALVDRAGRAQSTPAYRALNPAGLIPVLETPQGPLFETGAILLWLADSHGGLGPGPESAQRGAFLKWLFFAANTIHPGLRMLFYADRYIAAGHRAALARGLHAQLRDSLAILDAAAAERPDWLGGAVPTALDFYLGPLLRWAALYPVAGDRGWFELETYPALHRLCARLETLACTATLQSAEGLGDTPFTRPRYPAPPEGSAT